MNELFANWLHSGDKGLLRLVLPRETYLFLRAEKHPGFDYLYCQRQYLSLIHISEPTRLHSLSRMPSSA